jgi:hypothetical protein
MRMSRRCQFVLSFGSVSFLAFCWAGRADTQDINLVPTFGSISLKQGFTPNPFLKEVIAGGAIQTTLGGVKAWVANAPDFQLNYEAGKFPYPLEIRVESPVDTTLLINLPDGTWIADDDSGGNLNPLLRFARPQSGRYDIYVGTFEKELGKATLIIRELNSISHDFSSQLGSPVRAAPAPPTVPAKIGN